MKPWTKFFLILILIGSVIIVSGQETVKDYDGNVYKTVKTGTQVWIAEDLKVTHYSNGDPVPNVMEDSQWKDLTSGAYCDIANKPENTKVFGRLYNWYSAADDRNICPKGWHVPTDHEWQTLTTLLSGDHGPGGVLPASVDINQSLFELLPEPFRGYDGEFSHYGYGGGGWWSSTGCTAETAYYHNITYNTVSRPHLEGFKYYGYFIRCIKD